MKHVLNTDTHDRRRPVLWKCAVLLILLVDAAAAFAQSSNQTQRVDFSSFRIITDRNIFNPRRYARSTQRREPAARVDAFTLVGTMAYEKGPFAFFEGTSSDYRKVLKVADTIAGYRVTNIQYNSVKLANTTNEIQLAVGMQMRRDEDGPWYLASAADFTATSRGSTNSDSTSDNSGAAVTTADSSNGSSSTSAEVSDERLKKLMQRREQELNR